MNTKTIIVGGNFGNEPKTSSVVKKLSDILKCDCVNGGTMNDLIDIKLNKYDLVLWLANISNEEQKHYPRKNRGSVLICSKLIHDDVTDNDAVSRIFKMHGNAVISIRTDQNPFTFKLIDALGNVWCNTSDLQELMNIIIKFYNFTKKSIRYDSVCVSNDILEQDKINRFKPFIELNKLVADKSESMGGRYFGNCSTRCEKMFPSARINGNNILVSRRNVDKSRITCDDLVLVKLDNDRIEYNGLNKPSVDTPVQLKLYELYPNIKYMIHGHYYIDGAPFTEHYNLCGDVREVQSIVDVITKTKNKNCGVINLKNHGFLIYSSSLSELVNLICDSKFNKRQIGEEIIF